MSAGSTDAAAARARGTAGRRTALSDVVAGLLDSRHDLAGEHFDAELDSLERAGDVTPEAARILRYWQRASVRAVVDHARHVLPTVLAALEIADEEARRAVEDDADAWQRALQVESVTQPRTSSPAPTAPTSPGTRPSSLDDHRRRLLVAGLTRDAGLHD